MLLSGPCLTILFALAAVQVLANTPQPPNEESPPGVERLVAAYPEALCGGEANAVIWCDGTRTVYDDGRTKRFDEKLVSPDLEDQMSLVYPLLYAPPAPENFDPGRIRVAGFFEKLYGSSAAEVRRKLAEVSWLPGVGGGKIEMTTVGGVDRKLSAVSRDIQRLGRRTARTVRKVSGAFVWRKVAGTTRPSPHSYGIAIDVGLKRASYWRWARPGPDGLYSYRNRIPLDVVEAFERQGFIWGGKWYHFDSMHFEYRPELTGHIS